MRWALVVLAAVVLAGVGYYVAGEAGLLAGAAALLGAKGKREPEPLTLSAEAVVRNVAAVEKRQAEQDKIDTTAAEEIKDAHAKATVAGDDLDAALDIADSLLDSEPA